jgi:hypothetical protein
MIADRRHPLRRSPVPLSNRPRHAKMASKGTAGKVAERALMTFRSCELGTSVKVRGTEELAYGNFMSQPRAGVTVAAAIARSLALLLSGRVRFVRGDIGRTLTMEDGKQFSVFRHARVKAHGPPTAVFIVRFTPAHMSVRQNIRFSLLPMVPLLGMPGFREKHWCVNRQTGGCQGIYAWQTAADAHAYAGSVALRFMTSRSLPGSVSHQILDQSPEYWAFR